MKRILIVQFRKNRTYREAEKRSFENIFGVFPVSLTFLDAFNFSELEDFFSRINEVDGVIFGGSGELNFDGGECVSTKIRNETRYISDSLREAVSLIDLKKLPTLGICFGHQLFGYQSGVSVVNDLKQQKAGTHIVKLTNEGRTDLLFSNIPDSFYAQYGHKDALTSIPQNALLLAQGESCNYAALKFNNHRYSVQFHPELSENDIRDRFLRHPEFLPHGITVDEVVSESPHAVKILNNFVTFLVLNK